MKKIYITQTKNKEELSKLIRREILKGNIVLKKEKLSITEEANLNEEEIIEFKNSNKKKIEIADEIIVVNEEEGKKEIEYAEELKKEIIYIKKENKNEFIDHDKKIIEEKSLLLNISKDGEILIPKEALTKGYAIHLRKKLKLKLPIKAI